MAEQEQTYWDAEEDALSPRALSLYRDRLGPLLEPEQTGRGLAIHPDSGDYEVADTPTEAGKAMRLRHPEGGTVTLRIGLLPEPALAARLLGGLPTTGRVSDSGHRPQPLAARCLIACWRL